ncbi:hypothetical protein DL93DRAFT_1858457 [Clavulina sp. PMI_390]|nr:hypothetical protein DL93DRAFT_1858457 [Clavulina sp. PMI_390]
MGYDGPERNQSLCYECGSKPESPMNGKGSHGTHRVGLASHHILETSVIGRGYQRTIAMLLNAAITGLTFKYPGGGECGPHDYEWPQQNKKLTLASNYRINGI